jgi:hypothetical protein
MIQDRQAIIVERKLTTHFPYYGGVEELVLPPPPTQFPQPRPPQDIETIM